MRGVDKRIAAVKGELAYGADKGQLVAELEALTEEKARLSCGVLGALGAREDRTDSATESEEEEEEDATPPPKEAMDEDSDCGEADVPAERAMSPTLGGRGELVTEQELRENFHLPLHTVAKKFGMCTTAFKKM